MARSKKIFLIISGLFILLMIIFTIDIFNRTSRPGKRRSATEQPLNQADTSRSDTLILPEE